MKPVIIAQVISSILITIEFVNMCSKNHNKITNVQFRFKSQAYKNQVLFRQQNKCIGFLSLAIQIKAIRIFPYQKKRLTKNNNGR